MSWSHSVIVGEGDIDGPRGSSEVLLCSVENCNPLHVYQNGWSVQVKLWLQSRTPTLCIQVTQVGDADEITTHLLSMAAREDASLLKA